MKLKNLSKEGWSGIDVQLKRRADLIPELVNTVKAYAAHERELFEKVTELRNETLAPHTIQEHAATAGALSRNLQKLLLIAEDYPEVKANTNFLELQKELSRVENTLQKARRYYNGTVRELNIKIESFPSNIVAKGLGFEKRTFFSIGNEGDRNLPEINLA
ncbi:LemA family protein [Pleomorphovibrio marinus]|uniref:LemA family protein n=1 Tax=Pleomorphovibrio marinus TaxID=2164132 RepID=UPI001E34A3AC|nr:LemA family protein [Pleomorphovibrio marinus]